MHIFFFFGFLSYLGCSTDEKKRKKEEEEIQSDELNPDTNYFSTTTQCIKIK